MAAAREEALPCPVCGSSHTRQLSMLSAQDVAFDFFMCDDCDHAWKAAKTLNVDAMASD